MKNLLAAYVLGTASLLTAAISVSAATVTTYDNKMTFETPNTNWYEQSNPNTKITLTNGQDTIDVLEYDIREMKTAADIPTPILKANNFEEIYQSYYTVNNSLYMITGYAKDADDMTEVRSIIASMKLIGHDKDNTKTNTQNNNNQNQDTDQDIEPSRTGNEITLYYKNSNSITVYEYTDGKWKDNENLNVEYWATTDGEWSNSKGEILYTYIPEVQSENEKTGNQIVLFYPNSNSVGTVYEYNNGKWLDDAGISYINYGDYWVSSQGVTVYDHILSIEELRELEEQDSDDFDDDIIDDDMDDDAISEYTVNAFDLNDLDFDD